MYTYIDNFLKKLKSDDQIRLNKKLEEIKSDNMEERLYAWFANFRDEKEKELALKIFLNIEYVNHNRIETILELYKTKLKQRLQEKDESFEKENPFEKIIVVTPDGKADSADSLAYYLRKAWNIKKEQVSEPKEIMLKLKDINDKYLVLFNDTHGTGKQFLKQFSTLIDKVGSSKCFIICYTLHEKAFKVFKNKFPSSIIIPEEPTKTVEDIFTHREYKRIKLLGKKVYKTYPLGYGGCGLLVAYYFQCPNNSLPIIWADGKNNSYTTKTGENKTFYWIPLFSYIPKKKQSDEIHPKSQKDVLLSYQKSVYSISEKLNDNPNKIKEMLLNAYIEELNNIMKFLKENKKTLIKYVDEHNLFSVDVLRKGISECRTLLMVAKEAFEESPIDYHKIYNEYAKAAEIIEQIEEYFLPE